MALDPIEGGMPEPLNDGFVLALAEVVDWKIGHTTTEHGPEMPQTKFDLRVHALGVEPYEVSIKQYVWRDWLARQRADRSRRAAVRINKADRTDVWIAFDVDPRFVLVQDRNLKEIREHGDACEVIVISAEPFIPALPLGDDFAAWHFDWTVIPGAGDAYMIGGVEAVSPRRLPLVYPGSRLPAKVRSSDEPPAIDWDAALAATP